MWMNREHIIALFRIEMEQFSTKSHSCLVVRNEKYANFFFKMHVQMVNGL